MSLHAVTASQGVISGLASVTLTVTPTGNALTALTAYLASCKTRRRVIAYTATLPALFDALIGDHAQGRDVKAIFDASEAHRVPTEAAQLARLKAAGLVAGHDYVIGTAPTKQIVHAKCIIQDGTTLALGSFNFTRLAEAEINDLAILENADIASFLEAQFDQWWQWICAHEPQS